MFRLLPLGLGALILVSVMVGRAPEYDEGYTLFLAAGHRLPTWPDGAFTAAAARAQFLGQSDPAGIAEQLRAGDVHPPLYFWMVAAWRAVVGSSLLVTRALSAICGIACLVLIGGIAGNLGVPQALAVLLAGLSYGLAYTGGIARGFALAQALSLAGVYLLTAKADSRRSFIAGLLIGLATTANYLTAFIAIGAMPWLLKSGLRRAVAYAAGVALFLPIDLWFFLAQRGSRAGQFPDFHLADALLRVARVQVAAIYGGLPLYAGEWADIVAGAVAVTAVVVTLSALARARGSAMWLAAPLAASSACGLIMLGLTFGNSPIELRYLVFSLPYVALLTAASAPRPLLWVGISVQAAGIVGLLLAPETMQPQARAARLAARADAGLVLLPEGNDGVGIPAAFITAAPDTVRIRLVRRHTTPDEIEKWAADKARVALARLALDSDSRAEVAAMDAAFAGPCWETHVIGPTMTLVERGDADCEWTNGPER